MIADGVRWRTVKRIRQGKQARLTSSLLCQGGRQVLAQMSYCRSGCNFFALRVSLLDWVASRKPLLRSCCRPRQALAQARNTLLQGIPYKNLTFFAFLRRTGELTRVQLTVLQGGS